MKDEAKTKRQLMDELKELRQDVASLQKAEEELTQVKESQQKFTKAFMQNSIPMSITTLKEGRFVEVSVIFLKLMGLERDKVIGNTFTGIGFITEEQRAMVLKELNKKGRVENLELQVRTKGGEVRYGLFNAVMMTIGNEKYLHTVMTDITERKRAEEALIESEEQFRGLIENMPIGIFIYE
ncbi:MAG: PAS domain S-box protein, partial [Syntrophaceae bacterium]|nr:PAS domain S-box protein [Syntrophaceae bacterium]